MNPLPSISKGLGALTPQVWQRVMKSVKWIEENGKSIVHARSKHPDWMGLPEVSVFPAVITEVSCVQIDPLRYKYGWEMLAPKTKTTLMVSAGATGRSTGGEVTKNLSPGYGRRVYGSVSGGGYGPAVNTPEWGHSDLDNIPPGFDKDDSAWPNGFEMQPIVPRTMVIMYMLPREDVDYTDSEEKTTAFSSHPFFCLSNIVMGRCT